MRASNAAHDAVKLVDKSTSAWNSGSSGGGVSFSFFDGKPYEIDSYALTCTAVEDAPKSWILEGSNNEKDWVILDTQKDRAFSSGYQTRLFRTDSSTAYHHYRLNVTRSARGKHLNLTEVALLDSRNPAVPPRVSISAPFDGALLPTNRDTIIKADASDADGKVVRVDFYCGDKKLGDDTTAPYSYTWDKVPAGSYDLTAVAVDSDGRRTVSAGVGVTRRRAAR